MGTDVPHGNPSTCSVGPHTRGGKTQGKGSRAAAHAPASRSVNLLRPHGLYSPWNSPGQNTGVGSCSLNQGLISSRVIWLADLLQVAATFAVRKGTSEMDLEIVLLSEVRQKKSYTDDVAYMLNLKLVQG